MATVEAKLTLRERETLWAFLAQNDMHEVAFELGIAHQTAQNHLVSAEGKLGFTRRELLCRLFSAFLKKIKKS